MGIMLPKDTKVWGIMSWKASRFLSCLLSLPPSDQIPDHATSATPQFYHDLI